MSEINSIIKPIYRTGVVIFMLGIEFPICGAVLYPTYIIGGITYIASLPIDYIINGDTEYSSSKKDDALEYIEKSLCELAKINKNYIC